MTYGDDIKALTKLRLESARSELRWQRGKRGFLALMTIWGTGFYFYLIGDANGLWSDTAAAVPIVRIEGGIAPGADFGSADTVISSLKTAFDNKDAPGVVIYIDSPGGSPAEAERINHIIDTKKKETGKKVYAVCGNLCASAGYMIAMHADEVYAGRYSLVGSIGAIMSSWNFSDTIGKFGAQHYAYASGKHKAMLNPYIPVKEEDRQKAQSLVSAMGGEFADEVKRLRGKKLAQNVDLFTGEVWGGEDAKQHGLIDGVASLNEVITTKFGKEAKTLELNKTSKGFSFLNTATDSLTKSVAAAIVNNSESITLR